MHLRTQEIGTAHRQKEGRDKTRASPQILMVEIGFSWLLFFVFHSIFAFKCSAFHTLGDEMYEVERPRWVMALRVFDTSVSAAVWRKGRIWKRELEDCAFACAVSDGGHGGRRLTRNRNDQKCALPTEEREEGALARIRDEKLV